jgi:hypothetical protein
VPAFVVSSTEGLRLVDSSPAACWRRLARAVNSARTHAGMRAMVYAGNISGEWFFGLHLDDTARRIEGLPGAWRCVLTGYRFVFEDPRSLHDRELELHSLALLPAALPAVSAAGCARAEVYVRRGVHRRLRRYGQAHMKVWHGAARVMQGWHVRGANASRGWCAAGGTGGRGGSRDRRAVGMWRATL